MTLLDLIARGLLLGLLATAVWALWHLPGLLAAWRGPDHIDDLDGVMRRRERGVL